tara:strand:- start:1687 stop:1971 length:285 start_codon:yes stop_codon:yes gene_type:complete
MTNTITIVTPSFIDDGIELRVEYFKGRSDIDRTHLYEGDYEVDDIAWITTNERIVDVDDVCKYIEPIDLIEFQDKVVDIHTFMKLAETVKYEFA